MSNSNENTVSTPSSTQADKRLGRTALIVLLITLVTSGAFAGVAFGLGVDATTQDALAALMYPIAGVGVLWSIILLVRAMRMGEPLLYTGIALFILLWGATVALAATWMSERGSTNHQYIIHFLCLPVVVPVTALAITIALPLYFWKKRKALRAAESERPQLLRRARNWSVATVLFIVLSIGPFVFYAYGSTMGYARDSQIWSYGAVEYMPRWMGDMVYRVWTRLPKKARGTAPEVLSNRGLLSASFHYEIGMDAAKNGAGKWLLENFVRYHPEDAMAFAREAFAQRDYSNPIFNTPMGEVYCRLVSREELVEIWRVEHASKFPKDFQIGLFLGASATKFKSEILEAALAWFFSKKEPIASGGRRLILMQGSDNDVLQVIRHDVDARDYKSIRDTLRYIRPQKSAKVLDALLTHSDENVLASVHSSIFNDETLAAEIRTKRNLPELIRPLLENSSVRVGTALVILFLREQITPEIKALYFVDKRKSNRIQVDSEKLSAASEAENNAVIEQARELLKKW